MTDLIIKNGSCFIDDNLVNTDIAIKDKKIVKIGKNLTDAKEIIDASGLTVLPGCIDTQLILENQAQRILKICILGVGLQLLEE